MTVQQALAPQPAPHSPIYKSAAGKAAVMDLYDRALQRWPVPYTTATVATRQGPTFVIASGPPAAPPLLLLHGAASNALAWMGEVAAYSGCRRVYAVDLPGEPGRSAPNRPPWQGPAYVEWVEDLLAGLAVDRPELMGISQGGWTALKFATACPERVARLVLLAPGGVAPARLSFILRAIPLSLLGRRGADAINRITFGDEPIHPDAVAFMHVIMTNFKPRIGALPIFTDAELGRLSMPVLLVVGGRDALLPSAKTAARLERCVPQLTVQRLPEAGHVLHNLSGIVLPFLTE